MGFRQDGKSKHEWDAWVDANRELLDALALPNDVVESRDAFDYFLQHGYNRDGWRDTQPWFETADEQSWEAQFWLLIQSYVSALYPYDERDGQLVDLGWQHDPERDISESGVTDRRPRRYVRVIQKPSPPYT